jgi:hypothetical protein
MGFAVNRRHGRLMTPTFKVLLEGGAFLCAWALGRAMLPGIFLLIDRKNLKLARNRALDGWTHRNFPEANRAGEVFMERFLDDLEHRYPGSTA